MKKEIIVPYADFFYFKYYRRKIMFNLMAVADILPIILGGAGFLVLIFVLSSYVKVKPNRAFIITGPKSSRVVTKKATFRIPFFERIDVVPLDIIQVDIKTTSAVPTNEFIDIFVDGVANIKVKSTVEDIKLAGEIFLSMGQDKIKAIAQEVLEGNMREIIGQMKLTELVQNRDKFADEVSTSAMKDMERMGLEIINLTIQNFTDKNGVIQDLGVDNIAQIRKVANIAKAEAERDINVATSKAKEVSNNARIDAELLIAEQDTNLLLKKAALKKSATTEQASADAAYAIREAEELKTINIAKQNASIAMREKEIELKTKEVEVQERFLEATIKKQSEADKYAEQQKAEADLYRRIKDAEAKLAEKTREAEALKVDAEAQKYKALQNADAIKAEAEARKVAALEEAEGIIAKGQAEAEAIEKKALAMKKMEEAAVLELVLKSDVLPKIVSAAAAPLAQTEKIIMYGEGNSAKLSQDIMKTSTNILEGIKESTGMDLMSLITGFMGGKLTGGNDAEVVETTPKPAPKKAPAKK
jgi:flotillin